MRMLNPIPSLCFVVYLLFVLCMQVFPKKKYPKQVIIVITLQKSCPF